METGQHKPVPAPDSVDKEWQRQAPGHQVELAVATMNPDALQ